MNPCGAPSNQASWWRYGQRTVGRRGAALRAARCGVGVLRTSELRMHEFPTAVLLLRRNETHNHRMRPRRAGRSAQGQAAWQRCG